MDYTPDGDSEVEAYEADTYALLESGDLKVMSDEGMYRCPFCSDAEKGYNLHELLQHASGLEAAHDWGAKDKADHRALAKHLKGKPFESPGSVLQPMLTYPKAPQHNRDEQFVWPWMGILVNMPNEYFGKSANRLKEHFSCFHPVNVYPVYNKGRPTRNAIIEFGKDWSGFRNARAFESHFAVKGYGKNCWKEMKCGGTEPIGWMASSDDYNSSGAVGELLRKNCDLKTFGDIENEGTNKTDKLVANLAYHVKEKETHLEELECEYNKRVASLDVMMEKRGQLIQSYNQEILKMQQLSQQNTQRVIDKNKKLRSDLQGMMDEIDTRSNQIEDLAAQTGRDLELEKQKNAMKANHLRLATLEQQKADENVVKLLKEQKRENVAALEKLRRLTIQLDTKQNLELEIKHLMGKLQVMEFKSGAKDSKSGNRIAELREELNEKIDELKEVKNYNQALIVSESKYSDELREARKALIDALHCLPDTTGGQRKIGIKRVGELDTKAFLDVCKRKFPEEDAEAESAILCSKWQNEINNPDWKPVVDGKELEVLREDEKKLQELKEYGEEAYGAVATSGIRSQSCGTMRRGGKRT